MENSTPQQPSSQAHTQETSEVSFNLPFVVPTKSAAQTRDETVSHPRCKLQRTDSVRYPEPATRMTKPAGAPRPKTHTPLIEKAENPIVKNYWQRAKEIRRSLDNFVQQVAEARNIKDKLTPADYHQILFELMMQSPGLYCISSLPPKIKAYEFKNIIFASESVKECSLWIYKQIAEGTFLINQYCYEKQIDMSSTEADELREDLLWYKDQCKSAVLKQIFKDHQALFPGAIEQSTAIYNAIFEPDDQGNIPSFRRHTFFQADERDSLYLKCLAKIVPNYCKSIFHQLLAIDFD